MQMSAHTSCKACSAPSQSRRSVTLTGITGGVIGVQSIQVSRWERERGAKQLTFTMAGDIGVGSIEVGGCWEGLGCNPSVAQPEFSGAIMQLQAL